ncbi:hypothetical protein [Nocardioides pelophilus]|uniref:hypothetical protein n=1 Tax=Nocardioides pelophilus TaxID=2172019 RepID=UPI001601CD3F|nr:hypothetical protein [Nocardioides pelophilus]
MGSTVAGITAVVVLGGCGPGESSGGGNPGCTSHYEQIAAAPTLAALKRELVAQTPRASSVRLVGRDGDKRNINVLSAKSRTLLSLDAWQLDDGSWTAEQWNQCID